MIRTKPFRENHLDIFECQESYKAQCYEAVSLLSNLGFINQAGSHFIEGRLLYVSGYFMVAPGVIEVFIYPSIYTSEYALQFFREVHWYLRYLSNQKGVRRVQTWGDDTAISDKWLKALGFCYEGRLEYYRQDNKAVSIWRLENGRDCNRSD